MLTHFAPSLCWAAGLTLLSALVTAQPDSSRRALNLVTCDEVSIARPASAIWPLILHESVWKKAVKLQHVEGPSDAVGEVFAARTGDAGSPILFYLQTMELLPLKRRTLKLYGVNDGPLIGFAAFELEELHGETKVTYRVYAEFPAGPEQTPQQFQALQSRYSGENETRFREELTTLKHLAEAH